MQNYPEPCGCGDPYCPDCFPFSPEREEERAALEAEAAEYALDALNDR